MKSDNVKKGIQQAPHRSLFNALGMTKEEMERPLVGIVSSYNEIVPGHMNLDKIVNAVKQGVAMAGGTPVVFPAIALVEEGDIIKINIPENRLELAVSDEELARRKAGWTPREPKVKTGYLARYASMVTSGNRGAILVSEK